MAPWVIERIPYESTGHFGPWVRDYLSDAESLRPFFHRRPERQSLIDQAAERSDFPMERRRVLVEVLREQYARCSISVEGLLQTNLDRLEQPDSRTVVTGHQLNLFGGPLYVLYKLAHIVAQARELNASGPGFHTIPVFWLATEDHDYAEVDHVHFRAQPLRAEGAPLGAVGRRVLGDLESLISGLETLLGTGKRAAAAGALLRRAYRPGQTWAEAMRILAHEWFGAEGLVILDADDARLKRFFVPVLEQELRNSSYSTALQHTTQALSESYSAQAFVRPINVFYLGNDIRSRIEREGEGYRTTEGGYSWSESTLVEELHAHPERFSPNVLLRPLYQETILPNLAYTGGGGELAYWFQLRSAFETAGIPMPVLILRQSFLWVLGSASKIWAHTGVSAEEWFVERSRFIRHRLAEHSPLDLALKKPRKALDAVFEGLYALAAQTDESMERAVEAERMRHQKGLHRLEGKLIRAEKRRLGERVLQWERAHAQLFPQSGLQERFDSYWDLYAHLGPQTPARVLEAIAPFEPAFLLIREPQ